MSNAPVCSIQPVITTQQPPPVAVPSIPQATDLASAIAAINAIGVAIRQIMSQLPPVTSGGGQYTNKAKDPPKQGRWNQVNRITQQVKVTNPNDPTQYVIIDRIQQLIMRDSITGETWVWNR